VEGQQQYATSKWQHVIRRGRTVNPDDFEGLQQKL
jgi:hypothetical protein